MAAGALAAELGPFSKRRGGGPGGWVLLPEPELHLSVDVLVPDLAGWRRDRMPEMPDVPFFTLAPDWACEILSSATRAKDLRVKRPIYAREAVSHLWLADPKTNLLEAFELDDGAWKLLGTWEGDTLVRIPPFDAIEVDLGALWAR